MPAPTIFRSTDSNAPVMWGGPGALVSLLDACLVNGYGSSFAAGTITNDGSQPTAGDTITVGGITYTFGAVTSPYAVGIGGSVAATMTNLEQAINGTGSAGVNYGVGTLANPDAYVSAATATVITVTARKGGSAGNSIALARAAAGTPHFSVSGANLSGGGGTDSKVSVGWTKSFTGSDWMKVAYRQPAGQLAYLQVDDSGPSAAFGKEARGWGFETMTAYNTGTGQFGASGSPTIFRKSQTLDAIAVPRVWTLIADDRTFYCFIQTADVAAAYLGTHFGDLYSLLSGDTYKCAILGRGSENSGTPATTEVFGDLADYASTQSGHWAARSFTGVGGPKAISKSADRAKSTQPTQAAYGFVGNLGFPHSPDGGLYLCPVYALESTPNVIRGKLRGLYQPLHAVSSFADGETFPGTGAYAGRTFMFVKGSSGSGAAGAYVVETTAWDTSA